MSTCNMWMGTRPGGLYKELDFLWLYLVNPGTLRKCMSTYALIVVTVISLLFSSSSIVAGIVSKNHLPAFLDKIKVYKRDGLKNHHNHSKSSRYTYCYCIFFLCLPLPQILYFTNYFFCLGLSVIII